MKARKGVPTCYIFSCPQDYRSPRPPLHALVPQGPSREPGLILISPAGQIRFWDSISMGLAGGDNFIASQIEEMDEEEEVTNLVSADVCCCIKFLRTISYQLEGVNIYSFHIFRATLPPSSLLDQWETSSQSPRLCTTHRVEFTLSHLSVIPAFWSHWIL
jgi:hypothetical protein